MRHFQTGYISPQYHVVFDDIFQNLYSSRETDIVVDYIRTNLFEDNRDWYSEGKY